MEILWTGFWPLTGAYHSMLIVQIFRGNIRVEFPEILSHYKKGYMFTVSNSDQGDVICGKKKLQLV